MRLASAIMTGATALALTGCGTRAAEMSTTPPPRRALSEHCGWVSEAELNAVLPLSARSGWHGDSIVTTDGAYFPGPDMALAAAKDPSHPTDAERWVLVHELAHRIEARYGWQAAAGLWKALPPEFLTHPEIAARLARDENGKP